MIKCLFNKLLFFLLLTAFLLGAKNEGLAAEFDFDYNSPLLNQFATYTINELSKAIRGEEVEMIESAKQIDHGATQEVTLKRIRLFKNILVALEGGRFEQDGAAVCFFACNYRNFR